MAINQACQKNESGPARRGNTGWETEMVDTPANKPRAGGFLGSLKDALAAASRDETGIPPRAAVPAPINSPPPPAASPPPAQVPPPVPADPVADLVAAAPEAPRPLSAAEAAQQARGVASLKQQDSYQQDRHMEFDGTNTTRIVRGSAAKTPDPRPEPDEPARTQLVRGRQTLKRGQFVQDPVVGWLVVTGGPGLGSFRPVFEGNNSIGRSPASRIPLDFGDDSISFEEQAYVRYDGNDRGFLFVPNMSKTNVVSVNAKRPTSAIELAAMDVIVMGRTQLVFMPFCGPEFDWSEISETKD